MAEFAANFSLNNNSIDAQFDLSEGVQFDALFEIYAAGTVWGSISGTLSNQTDLQAALDLKADKTELNTAVSELNTAIQNEATTRAENDTLLQNNINTLSQTVTDNYNTLDGKIDTEISDRTAADTTLQNNIDAEALARQNADTTLQGNIDTLSDTVSDNDTAINNKVDGINTTLTNSINSLSNTVTSNYNSLDARITTNTGNIATNAGNITTINSKIPNQASSSNQLADKDFVNSSIATNTANFIGTFNSVAELEAYTGTLTNNDYAFVATTDAVGNTLYDRYKYNADTQEWLFEYELNNSSFTAAQWASINSGATSTNIGQITTNANNIADLQTNKQDVISDLTTIRSNALAGKNASDTIATYGNIVTHNVSEFATSSQGALADTALQPNDNISELTNDAGYITSASLPTVNNGTLTIQANGTTVGTFTANQAGNTTANIVVPDSATWGNITGTLSNQTDLQNALDAKYDASNPEGYITSADLPTNYVTTNTAQDISGRKTFLGEKAIYFKQSATTNKLGFTLYNPSNSELGALEYRPSTINGNALLAINCPQTTGNYVGFRYWGTPAINIVAPKVATAGNYYIPTHITDGNTTVTASNTGTVNISTLLPTVNNGTITINQGGVEKGTFTLNQSGSTTINLDAGGSDIDIDNTSITTNTSDELQTVGVIDQNNNTTAIKTWTGTKAQYDAIVTKDANTLYNITDDTDTTLSLLELLYPVGSIYIGTMATCPLQTLGVGTWQLVATDRVLQGAGTRGNVGTTVNESLPNITGEFDFEPNICTNIQTESNINVTDTPTGAFEVLYSSKVQVKATNTTLGSAWYHDTGISFNASLSNNTYQDNAPVQQDAYLVNIWERIS